MLLMMVLACGGPEITCGEGTRLEGTTCIAESLLTEVSTPDPTPPPPCLRDVPIEKIPLVAGGYLGSRDVNSLVDPLLTGMHAFNVAREARTMGLILQAQELGWSHPDVRKSCVAVSIVYAVLLGEDPVAGQVNAAWDAIWSSPDDWVMEAYESGTPRRLKSETDSTEPAQ